MAEGKDRARTHSLDPESNLSSLESILRDLSSDNDQARVRARFQIVTLGNSAVPYLIEFLRSKKRLLRWEAAKALEEISDPESASALVEALEDEEFDVRWLSAEALVRLGFQSLGPLLRALMIRGDSVWLREGAHHVIHDLNKGALMKYLSPLHKLLTSNRSLKIRWAAKSALEALEKDKIL